MTSGLTAPGATVNDGSDRASLPRASRATLVAAAALALLTLAAWAALLAEAFRATASGNPFLDAICRPVVLDRGFSPWSVLADLSVSAGLWIVMSVAMMLPTATPMVFAYADMAERRAAAGQRSASPLVLMAGYLSVWAVVAAVAALAQTGFALLWPRLGVPAQATTILAGFAIGGAGLYQFSEWKQRCLVACRHPLPALEAGSSARAAQVFRMGVGQGLSCLGCCGAIMALMLLAGAMNLVWMAIMALASTVEKMTTGAAVPRIIGAVLIAAGLALAVSAVGPEAVWRAMQAR